MNKSKENTQKATANKAINKEEKNMRTQNTATANLKATFKGYKPTTAREFKTLTATEKRDRLVDIIVHNIFNNNGYKVRTQQDGKGRINVYNTANKVVLKYRPHRNGIVIYYPTRTRECAIDKLTQHGYFTDINGGSYDIVGDTASTDFYKRVQLVADYLTAQTA